MPDNHGQLPQLDFDEVEHQRNLENLDAMEEEIANRNDGLTERISHFSERYDLPMEAFWAALEANPRGPLAAVLSTDARRQNIHEEAAANFIRQLDNVKEFRELPRQGRGVHYIAEDGRIILRHQLRSREPRPSEAIDFTWQTYDITCYASQKYTREGGGNQDSRFDETVRLLSNFRQNLDENVALFVILDGAYFTDNMLEQLQELVKDEGPHSYIVAINDLQQIINQII